MKKYKLLKNLPTFDAGDIFRLQDDGCLYYFACDQDSCKATHHWSEEIMAYHRKTLERFPNILDEWFEEIEPETFYMVNAIGTVSEMKISWLSTEPNLKAIGNYFETKEEAEKAVECLRAWKRLRDKGFRFEGWEDLQAEMGIDDLMLFNRDVINADNVIGFRMDDYHDCIKDLNICFGGEE